MVKQLKNDVAFKTRDNHLIIMVEHQSTLNENMPLRFLLYYAELLKQYISQNNLNIFSRRAIVIPIPEFYVVYNGLEELKENELFLKVNLGGADEYIMVKVNIVNINYEKLSKEILEREDTLSGYSYLMERIRHYMKQEKTLLEEAIENAVTDALQRGYLKEYLERKEFLTMITKVLTIEEEIELVRKDEREEGRKEGKEEGRIKEKIEIARTSIKAGIPKEVIAQITGLSIQEIEALVEK